MARQRKSDGGPATLADVARAAGTSIASASRALARPKAVSQELEVRVSQAALTLAYVPNSVARALVCRRSGLIGVVVGDLEGSALLPALFALEERLMSAGWSLLLGTGGTGETTADSVQALLRRGVEGLVFVGVDIPSDVDEMPGLRHLPRASVDREDHTGFIASAGLDLSHAGKLLAEFLGQLGHRQVAVVAESQSVIGALLIASIRTAAAPSEMLVEVLDLAEESIADGMLRWTALPNPPTAAICSSDAIALAVMTMCACHGIAIPGRMSVVGFGDTPVARYAVPTLTSVRIPAQRAGAAAAERLLAHFAGRTWIRSNWPVKLAVRGTTGPPGP